MAKEVKTIAGHVYTVTSPNGCTVTDENGKLVNTVDAGTQKDVRAINGKLVIDDEEGEVTKAVNFKGAGAKLRLLGAGVDALPAGYLRAEFLESTGEQCALLPFADNLSNIEFEMDAQFAATGQRQLMGYSNNAWLEVSGSGYFLINNPRDSAGSAVARCVVTYSIEWLSEGRKEKITALRTVTSPLITFDFQKQNGWMLCALIFKHNDSPSFFCRAKIWSAKLKLNDTSFDIVAALDKKGKPCFFDKKSKTPFYNYNTGADFVVGFTLKQALQLAKLPEGGGELTESLPWEAQLVGSGVPAALDEAAAKGWTIIVQYREPEPDSVLYTKYAECAKVADLQAVNEDYKADLTASMEWKWNLSKLKSGYRAFEAADVRAFYSDLSVLNEGSHMFNGSQIVIFKGGMERLNNAWNMFNNTPLEVIETDLSNLVEGLGMFNGCRLDKPSALNVLVSILSAKNSVMRLTIGIHVDHKDDEDIAAAIEAAQTEGWRITAQWNGTPTASTFALRRLTVWAKLVEAPDGSSVLDWGHYVTNWAENGYMEFASLEEAKEYFNVGDEV